MKRNSLFYTIVLAGSLLACQKEDTLKPLHMVNPFAPQPGAIDEESKLREEFYKNTGCHLLFNDTLRHEYQGLDGNGKPFYQTELLGLEYEILSYNNHSFRFDYLQTLEQKRQVIDFLQNNLLPYIKDIIPYSLLVANQINEYEKNPETLDYDSIGSPLTYKNIRCLALNVNQLWGLSPEERKTYAQDICYEIIFASFGGTANQKYTDGDARSFFQEGASYYGYPTSNMWLGITYNPLECGFLEDPYGTFFPSAKEDAVAYIKACLNMSEEEFFEKYGANDINGITRKKYDAIKPLIDATGIKFN